MAARLAIGGILVTVLAVGAATRAVAPELAVPYDPTSPVIYDNDEAVDVYTDDYLMALASAGRIRLVGMVTSSSVAPFNPYVPPERFDTMVRDRAEGVRRARASGLRNIPDPVRGPSRHLERPPSGRIEDTEPIGSPGTSLVVREARAATPERPLVLIMGGPLTLAADAYLHDTTIADRMIIGWVGDTDTAMTGYNGGADPWAAYIALQKLRLVMFPVSWIARDGDPRVPKAWLRRLPETPWREWMIAKDHPVGLPDERDADAAPAIAMMRPDYVAARLARTSRLGVKRLRPVRVSFSGWVEHSIGGPRPAFAEDSAGRAWVFPAVRREVGTAEWWRALGDPAVYAPERPGGDREGVP